MSQSVLLKAKGLFTFPNLLSEVPVGALVKADNVIINRDGVIEPRRGFKIYGDAMGVSTLNLAKQFLIYKNRILRHFNSTLEFDNSTGTFTAFTGSVSEIESGLRVKYSESNGNLFFTSSDGIKKISSASAAVMAAGDITPAGGIKALDTKLTLNPASGFFTQDSIVGYRVVWGIKDANNNVILGYPSERSVITNPITNLLTGDFNTLLSLLDKSNVLGGIDDQDYLSTLKVSLNSNPSDLRTNLISLATKIDNNTIITDSSLKTVARFKPTVSTASIKFNGSVDNLLAVGDSVDISGLADPELNHTFVITSITTTTVTHDTINFSGTFTAPYAGPTADTVGIVKRLKYTLITQPIAISAIPTTQELVSLQDFYNEMCAELQVEPVGITDSSIFDNTTFSQSGTVNLNFTIPQGVTTRHFYQIYRTALASSEGASSLSDLDPGDEMGLVFEANPTSDEITTGIIQTQDIVPDSFRGANLYTNPNSGEGISQANEVPPKAKDIALYRNYLFFGNTQTKYRKTISLLSVADMISGTSTFSVKNGTSTDVYTFVVATEQVTQVQTVSDVAGSLNNKYLLITSANDVISYYVWCNVNGAGVDPAISGKTGIEVALSTGDSASTVATKLKQAINAFTSFESSSVGSTVTITNADPGIATSASDFNTGFTVSVTTPGTGEDAANKKVLISELSTPAQQVDESARSLVRVINRNSNGLIYAYYISGPTDVPGIISLEARQLGNVAFYMNVDSTATGTQFSPALPTSGNTVISDNEVSPNRLYYAKKDQPEAVPLLNYFDVGPKDKKILRIVALRESLFVFKEEGIYRVSGETAPFVSSLFDSSTILAAPDTADILNNEIYLLSDQGVAKVSDTGISIISRPIEEDLVKLNIPSYTAFKTASFGKAYESDRTYYLWTVKDVNDTVATQCFRYNTFTNCWTMASMAKTCAVVNPADDKMYLGASDINYIEQERKDFDRTDIADRQYDFTLSASSVNGSLITMPSVTNITARDVVTQVQYLTVYQFNKMLLKLDGDNGVADTNYYSTLAATAGDDLRVKLTNLATKLDADTGIVDNTYLSGISGYTSSFADCQSAYNVIVTKLNADVGVTYSNYSTSTGTTLYEGIITEVDARDNTITTDYSYPFIAGKLTTYAQIATEVQWAPQTFGDVSMLKQVSEGTLIFEKITFSQIVLSFSTDLNPGFDEIEFSGLGNGTYGATIYGENTFGGSGNSIPFRTLIPREKQRCRYMNVRYKHATAREVYRIYGISLTVASTSQRAYK